MSLEEFYEVWDYVSELTITDDMWEQNIDCFKEITAELYRVEMMRKSNPDVNLKLLGKQLEIIFTTLKNNNLLNVK